MSNEVHKRLREVLVALYPTVLDLRRVTFDANVSVERVELQGSMLTCWEQVLQEAAKSQQMAALLEVVQTEYPHYAALSEVQASLASTLPEHNLHLLNFAREFTAQQRTQLEIRLRERLHRVISLPARFDDTKPYGPQCTALVDQIGWTPAMWESLPVVVNPPGFVPGALCLLAELHGRMGHFPSVVRLRPIEQNDKIIFVLGEVINLQMVRNGALGRGK